MAPRKGPGRCRWGLGLAAAVALTPLQTSGQVRDPLLCANFVVVGIDYVFHEAYSLVQAATDCTLPGLDELACAGDILDSFSAWFSLGSVITAATMACGSLHNGCAAVIITMLGDFSDVANEIVAANSDCISDPFTCSLDIVLAVDLVNGVVADLISALQGCNGGFMNSKFLYTQTVMSFVDPTAAIGGGGGYFERRLAEGVEGLQGDPNIESFARLNKQFWDTKLMRGAQAASPRPLEGQRDYADELAAFRNLTQSVRAAWAAKSPAGAERRPRRAMPAVEKLLARYADKPRLPQNGAAAASDVLV